jgi:hypothetical protein
MSINGAIPMLTDHTHLSAYLQPGTILSREDCDKLMKIVLERDDAHKALKEILDSKDALSRAGLNGDIARQGEAILRYRDALKAAQTLLSR